MDRHEMIPAARQPLTVDQNWLNQLGAMMEGMVELMRQTNERITELEQQVRLSVKVTPAQASAINAAVRVRAAMLCAEYGIGGCDAAVAAAIRKAVKLSTGVSSVRELPRCEYALALQIVDLWDDYKAIMAIKGRRKK